MMDHNTLTTWSTWIVMVTGSTTLLLLSAGMLLLSIWGYTVFARRFWDCRWEMYYICAVIMHSRLATRKKAIKHLREAQHVLDRWQRERKEKHENG